MSTTRTSVAACRRARRRHAGRLRLVRRRGRRRLQDRHPRQPRLVRRLQERPRRLREEVRLQGQGPQGRRRRAGRQQGDPHQGQPAGRRLLRRRQHPALPRARQRPVPAVRGQGRSTRSRPGTSSTRTSTGSRPSTPATSASTTTRRTSPSTSSRRRRSFDDLVKPAYKNLLVTENAATSSPGPRLPARHAPPSTATTAGRTTGRSSRPTASRSSTAGSRRTTRGSPAPPGGKKAKADRPLVVSYASSPPAEVIYADPKPTTAPTGVAHRHLLPADRVRRAARATRRTPRAARRCWTSCSPRSSSRTCRCNMFVYPVRRGRPGAGRVHQVRRRRSRTPRPWPRRRSPRTVTQWVKSWTSLVLK